MRSRDFYLLWAFAAGMTTTCAIITATHIILIRRHRRLHLEGSPS
jgi:hypothetical protein